jgi:hypothetical protein
MGCQVCTSSGCSQCGYNYQLVGGSCASISNNCSSITNCRSCVVSNGVVSCYICTYPYYLANGACLMGASLLCRSGATGVMYYDCLDSCGPYGYTAMIKGSNIVCLTYPWLNGVQQLYLNAYDSSFSGMLIAAGPERVYYDQVVNSARTANCILTFTLTLSPYYKTSINLKLVVTGQSSSNIDLAVTLSDNSSNSEQYNSTHSVTNNSYQPIYLTLQSKAIKDQLVTITIHSSTANSTYLPMVGLSECLIQIYPCPANCRLCYNA